MQVLILTGSFACAMAFHNVAMRYFYAMGREGILPRALGRTHRTHKSPYIASLVQTVFAVALVLAWGIGSGFSFSAAFDTAYVRIYTMMAVQGVVWILAIQATCALAVILWHRRHKHPDSAWVVVVCPIIAILGQVFAIYLLFKNIDVLAGTIGYVDLIAPFAVIGVVGSLGYALVLKRTQPPEVRPHRPDDRRGRHAVTECAAPGGRGRPANVNCAGWGSWGAFHAVAGSPSVEFVGLTPTNSTLA